MLSILKTLFLTQFFGMSRETAFLMRRTNAVFFKKIDFSQKHCFINKYL
jgi:hypothetical protein